VKEQNNRLGAAVIFEVNTTSHREDFISRQTPAETNDVCPDCRVRLIRLGACFSCPACGYGSCG